MDLGEQTNEEFEISKQVVLKHRFWEGSNGCGYVATHDRLKFTDLEIELRASEVGGRYASVMQTPSHFIFFLFILSIGPPSERGVRYSKTAGAHPQVLRCVIRCAFH